ncbi:MAG: hypothetical protein K9G41_10880 [Flavobacteriales bacterium]|nr:hypothetical protein [Flavobacteriales bacterium]
MGRSVQYIVDDAGKKKSVIIPFEEWKKQRKKLDELQNKLDVFQTITEGVSEVKDARKKGKELKNLSDFLDEC